jgi:hypothetical protein
VDFLEDNPITESTIATYWYTTDLVMYQKLSGPLVKLFNEVWNTTGVWIELDTIKNGFHLYFKDIDAFNHLFEYFKRSVPDSELEKNGFYWHMKFTLLPANISREHLIRILKKQYGTMRVQIDTSEQSDNIIIKFPNEESYVASFLELIQNHPNAAKLPILQ